MRGCPTGYRTLRHLRASTTAYLHSSPWFQAALAASQYSSRSEQYCVAKHGGKWELGVPASSPAAAASDLSGRPPGQPPSVTLLGPGVGSGLGNTPAVFRDLEGYRHCWPCPRPHTGSCCNTVSPGLSLQPLHQTSQIFHICAPAPVRKRAAENPALRNLKLAPLHSPPPSTNTD